MKVSLMRQSFRSNCRRFATDQEFETKLFPCSKSVHRKVLKIIIIGYNGSSKISIYINETMVASHKLQRYGLMKVIGVKKFCDDVSYYQFKKIMNSIRSMDGIVSPKVIFRKMPSSRKSEME